MATIGSVYDVTPAPRTSADVLVSNSEQPVPSPKAKNKWLTASVVCDAAEVVTEVFDEACRRDPGHERTWVALVDGNNHQIDRIEAEAEARQIDITIVIDLIHVLEYLSAPRGALSYPLPSREGMEEISLGLMAYLALKEKGDNSMPTNPVVVPRRMG
jgi:hypothetical protein